MLLPLERSAAQEAFSGVRNARATLLAGFTTVRDIGTYRAFVDAALRDAIDDGTVVGPRMAVAGAYVTVTSGAGEVTGAAPDVVVPPEFRFGVANTADEVRERVRALLNGGADFIKILATGAVLTRGTKPGVSEYTEAELHAAVEQAAEYGTFVAAHAHGAEGIKRAVRAGVRSIEHGSLIDDEGIALMKERGTWLVADIYNGDYIATIGKEQKWPAEFLRKNEETTEAQRAGFRKAVAAGVKIAYGTDSGVYPHGLQCAPASVHGPLWDDADAGAPVRDRFRRTAHGLGRPGRVLESGEVRRYRRGGRRCSGRPESLRKGFIRHEGWSRPQGAVGGLVEDQRLARHRGSGPHRRQAGGPAAGERNGLEPTQVGQRPADLA